VLKAGRHRPAPPFGCFFRGGPPRVSSGRSGKAAGSRGGAGSDSLGSENAGATHETVDLFLSAFGAGDSVLIASEHQLFKTMLAFFTLVLVDRHLIFTSLYKFGLFLASRNATGDPIEQHLLSPIFRKNSILPFGKAINMVVKSP